MESTGRRACGGEDEKIMEMIYGRCVCIFYTTGGVWFIALLLRFNTRDKRMGNEENIKYLKFENHKRRNALVANQVLRPLCNEITPQLYKRW